MVDVSHADHLCAYAQQELERTRQLESVLDQIHGRRQQFVAAHSEALKHRLEELVGKSRALELSVRQKEIEDREGLDTALLTSTVRFGQALERERILGARYHEELLLSIDGQIALRKQTFYLSLFALHLTWETNGVVQMRRLEADHSEFKRCCAAVLDNIKPSYFDGVEHASGIVVTEVFKMRHQVLLDEFRKQAALAECRIKGLFCSIPAESVERLVVYGFDEASEEARLSIFDPWVQQRQQHASQITKFIAQSLPVPNPLFLSRFSTLEEVRSMISAEPSDDSRRCLVLCRVIVPKSHTSTLVPRSEYVETHRQKAPMEFDNELQEFVCSRPSYVFPEYLMQYQYLRPSRSGVFGASPTVSGMAQQDSTKAAATEFKRLQEAERTQQQSAAKAATDALETFAQRYALKRSPSSASASALKAQVQAATEQLKELKATTAALLAEEAAARRHTRMGTEL